jgi:hypothetical protein
VPAVLTPRDRLWFTERTPVGIRFTERMSGSFVPTGAGEETEPFECTLTVIADDLERMLNGWSHEARLVGTAIAPSLAAGPLTVTRGRFSLFQVVPDRVETRRMRYRMTLTSQQGDVYYVCGFKEVRNSLPTHAWFDLTTLAFAIFDDAGGRPGAVRGLGVLRMSVADFLRQLSTIRARGARRFAERLDGPVRFISAFAGVVMNTYGRLLADSIIATPDPPPRPPRRRGPLTPDEPIAVTASDGFSIHLTRYPGDRNRPVILAPGLGVAASSYAADTVETNLVDYLHDRGFDVWLLDYRASPVFPPPRTPFAIDDIARRDWPAAVDAVLDRTRAGQVQILAHCVSSLALIMSLLDGRLAGKVRSVICSQVGAHPIVAPQNEVKVGIYLANVLRLFGRQQLSASFNPRTWGNWTMDQLLRLYPTRERCNNPVCRRILFIFHESFRHAQLNTATHDAMWRWYGSANLTAMKQLALMIREGRLVDAEGRDVYLPHAQTRLALPISFMHGGLNRAFLPRSTEETYGLLTFLNDPCWYRREVFAAYGHMDCFVGRQAAYDVYRWIVEQLDDPPQPRVP